MQNFIRSLLLSFTAISLFISIVQAQVPTTDSELELRIKNIEKQADSLRKEAKRLQDSLRGKIQDNDVGRLFFKADSLLNKFRIYSFDSEGNLKLDGDSAHWSVHLPDSLSIKGWAEKLPKNFHYKVPDLPGHKFFGRMPKEYQFEIPDIPEYKYHDGKMNPFMKPKQEKKKTPVPGFKGWYMQNLADL